MTVYNLSGENDQLNPIDSQLNYMTYVPDNTYRLLPIEALYKLLTKAVKDLLAASDLKSNDPAPFNALKKQVEILLDIIEEKERLSQ